MCETVTESHARAYGVRHTGAPILDGGAVAAAHKTRPHQIAAARTSATTPAQSTAPPPSASPEALRRAFSTTCPSCGTAQPYPEPVHSVCAPRSALARAPWRCGRPSARRPRRARARSRTVQCVSSAAGVRSGRGGTCDRRAAPARTARRTGRPASARRAGRGAGAAAPRRPSAEGWPAAPPPRPAAATSAAGGRAARRRPTTRRRAATAVARGGCGRARVAGPGRRQRRCWRDGQWRRPRPKAEEWGLRRAASPLELAGKGEGRVCGRWSDS